MCKEMEDIHIVYTIIILMLHLCCNCRRMYLGFPSSFFLIEVFYAWFFPWGRWASDPCVLEFLGPVFVCLSFRVCSVFVNDDICGWHSRLS